MATTNKIMVGIDDQVIELTGADKEAFLADRQTYADAKALLEAEQSAKRDARESAIKKLAEIAGLTKEELASIL
jgi:multidrug efflux pump subunit AcrA (membrane-fusion protein)